MDYTLKNQLKNRLTKQIGFIRESYAEKITDLTNAPGHTPEQTAAFVAHEEQLYAAAVTTYRELVDDVIDTALLAYPAAPVVDALNALKALVAAYAAVPAADNATLEAQAVTDYVNHLADDLQSITVPFEE